MADTKKKTEEKIELTFEQAAAELDKIVERLNAGAVALDETVELYEKGVKLADHCTKLLNEYDCRIEKAINKDKAGSGE